MDKKKSEIKEMIEQEIQLDLTEEPQYEIKLGSNEGFNSYKDDEEEPTVKVISDKKQLINCLRNEKVTIKHIDKQTGLVKDPKHVLYGGMAENAKKVYVVPMLRSGKLVDVLTREEKDYLEYVLGLEANALSIYNKTNNFWLNNESNTATVTLYKRDNYLDLSNPNDYIKYKILLANKDRIAPSIQALQDQPKASYEYVIISETDSNKTATTKLNTKKEAYKLLGKVEDDIDTMRFIVETFDGRPTAKTIKLEMLQVKVDEMIQNNAKMFVKIATDKLLPTKVLIKKAVEAGIIAKRGDFHYLRSDNTPLCEYGQEPTLNIAATFLSSPKHQELKFTIEAKLKEDVQ